MPDASTWRSRLACEVGRGAKRAPAALGRVHVPADPAVTTVFYAPPEMFDGARVVLPDAEARHATKVLRLRAGAEVVVVDGQGGRYTVRLARTSGWSVEGEVVGTVQVPPPPPLTLALGLLRAEERLEFALEKAVELGVTRFVTLLTERTEARRVRPERLRATAVAAMKQSLRAHLPEVAGPLALEALLGAGAILLHEGAPLPDALRTMLPGPAAPVTLLVGPEGGFSNGEIARARESGTRVASLGSVRLRAETAALVAATAVFLHRTDVS